MFRSTQVLLIARRPASLGAIRAAPALPPVPRATRLLSTCSQPISRRSRNSRLQAPAAQGPRRAYGVVADAPVPSSRKVWDSAADAVKDVKSGDVLLSGDTLINALSERKEVTDLTVVSNNVGSGKQGLGKLLHTNQIGTVLASYIGGNKHFEALYLAGAISLELIPQGTLVARLRAAAAGVPAFYTPTGARTAVEHGSIPIRYKPGGVGAGVAVEGHRKETREFGGRRYVMEEAIRGDVAFVRAWKVDEDGLGWVGDFGAQVRGGPLGLQSCGLDAKLRWDRETRDVTLRLPATRISI
ncbi:hypothetical protein EIP86_004185 [Pleurotus ostreatoroseus]|nr:hypothetical protein EIP86_004185 [Pleurotus ostreatoroseus]